MARSFPAPHRTRVPPARRVVVVAGGAALVGSLLFVAAVGTPARAASRPPAPTADAAAAVASATPLLSVRRAPGWVADTLAAQRVATALSRIVSTTTLGKATACLVVEQGGRVLAARDPATPVIPASNLKLLTATGALDTLGPSYRYTTLVKVNGAPVRGVVHGNLYLVGGGDPVLRTPDYEATLPDTVPTYTSFPALAAQVRAAGITEVTGRVIGDERRYDTQRSIPTWPPSYVEEDDVGPLSALEVDDGFTSTPAGFTAASDPAQAAAQTFTSLLTADGVDVEGATAGTGVTPPGATGVTSIRSAPLSQVLAAILTPSDDTAAELLTKELGRVHGAGGTTDAGTAVIRADLAADGLPLSGVRLVDGSGLDRGDRVTCGLIAAVLGRAGAYGPLAHDLPVAGRTGTLEDRMQHTPAEGRVLAKTGTLAGVVALSGYVLPSAAAPAPTLQLRTPVVFSLIMNGVTGSTGISVGDRVAEALAGYPVVPALSALEPLP